MKLTVETVADTDLAKAWSAYNSPEDIVRWNAASDDWHSPRSEVDLREGGTYTRVVPQELQAILDNFGRYVEGKG